MHISEREMQVVRLAAHGLSDKEIGAKLGLTIATVRTYWDRMRVKVRGVNRTHIVCKVLGLVNDDTAELTLADTGRQEPRITASNNSNPAGRLN